MLLNKRGQITLFIILGLVILGLVAGFIVLKSKVTETELSTGEVVEKTPADLRPVHNFVHECMEKVLIEGLKKAGEHGGYVEPLNEELSDKSFEVNHFNPTDSDGVSLSSEDELFVPYWFYQTKSNPCASCVVSTNKPSIEEIEEQLEIYFKREFNNCARDFVMFTKSGFEIEEKGELEPEISVAEKSVNFFLKYPLKIKKRGSSSLIEQFYVTVPLNFMDFYKLAEDIYTYESEVMPLDNFLINLISIHSGLSQYKLPPSSYEIEQGHNFVIWTKPQVDNLLRHVLILNFHYLRVKGTLNEQEVLQNAENDLEGSFFNGSILNVSGGFGDYDELEAEFFYVNWPLFFSIRPGEKEGIYQPIRHEEPHRFSFFPPTPINTYKFLYDVSVPILVRITQKNALFEGPFSFWFSMEATIKDNKNLLQWFAGNGTVTADQINDTINASDLGLIEKTLFCEDNQLLSGNVNVTAYSAYNGTSIEDAVVRFGCGSYGSCKLGKTDSNGVLSTKMPLCVGGYVLVEPPRELESVYSRKAEPLTTEIGVDNFVEVYLDRVTVKNISFKILEMVSAGDCCVAGRDINDHEMVMLTVKRLLKPGEIGSSFTQTFIYDPESDEPMAIKEIKLIPGEYEVTANYFDNEGFEIRKWCKHICKGIGCEQIETAVSQGVHPTDAKHACLVSPTCLVFMSQWVPEDPIEITPAPLGGVIMNNETGYWELTASDIYSYQDDVVFNILRMPTPTCLDDDCVLPVCIGLEEMGKTINYSKDFRNEIEPRFI